MNILLQTILDAAVSAICWYLVGCDGGGGTRAQSKPSLQLLATRRGACRIAPLLACALLWLTLPTTHARTATQYRYGIAWGDAGRGNPFLAFDGFALKDW
jgi:hypothetical protein